ncbi:MAG: rhomboid family intramembrane serine protease [Bacteroidota bacterium]
MFSFKNIPGVTKNLLILNILFYIATLVLMQKHIDAYGILGGHYVNSPLFQPYQVVTHFFMHSPDFFHILFNMLMLVSFGSHLERLWGPKRFFIFYIACALGAFALYNGIGVYQIMELKSKLYALGIDVTALNEHAFKNDGTILINPGNPHVNALMEAYQMKILTPMVGASGAVFGIMAAFAYLFPNTELMLLFPPIPIKAKYLMGIYFALEVYLSFRSSVNDNVAHLAHVGGAIVGFALVYFWNKNRKHFY